MLPRVTVAFLPIAPSSLCAGLPRLRVELCGAEPPSHSGQNGKYFCQAGDALPCFHNSGSQRALLRMEVSNSASMCIFGLSCLQVAALQLQQHFAGKVVDSAPGVRGDFVFKKRDWLECSGEQASIPGWRPDWARGLRDQRGLAGSACLGSQCCGFGMEASRVVWVGRRHL